MGTISNEDGTFSLQVPLKKAMILCFFPLLNLGTDCFIENNLAQFKAEDDSFEFNRRERSFS